MASNEGNRTGNRVCKHLRSKEMFYQSETGARAAGPTGSAGAWTRCAGEDDDLASGLFWCMHSQTCLGPDGGAAGDEECLPGRLCYEV